MTLSKGDKLFKVQGDKAGRLVFARWSDWLLEHQEEGTISERDLAQILCPNESYVVHEVMSDVHYQTTPPSEGPDRHENTGYSYAPAVDLKVLY